MLEDLANTYEDLVKITADELTKKYTNVLIKQCATITEQLNEVDPTTLHLIAIQATYDAFKYQVSRLNNIEAQKHILKVFELESQNLVYPVAPTVDYEGNA